MDDEWQRLRQMIEQRIADVGSANGGDETYRTMVSTELTKIRGWMVRLEKNAPQSNPPIHDFEPANSEWFSERFSEMMREHQAEPPKMQTPQKIAIGILFFLFFLSLVLMAWVWAGDSVPGKLVSLIPVWSFRPRARWFDPVRKKL